MANETGFGSPTITPVPIYYDWGFGSPAPTDLDTGVEDIRGRDTAFGSPYDPSQAAAFLVGEQTVIPDDGGIVLEINSDWSRAGFYTIVDGKKQKGQLYPFEVNFIDSDSGDVYAAIGELSNNCTTNYEQDRLFAGVPPLPHGTYDIQIEWFDGTRQIYIDNAFEVALRPRCKQAYGLRQHLPEWFKTGVPRLDAEEITTYEGFSSNLEMLTKTIGDSLQRIYGSPCTALVSDLSYGDDSILVESTIGFPDSGSLYIGPVRYSYTSKTDSSFEGAAALLYHEDLLPRTEVIYALSY